MRTSIKGAITAGMVPGHSKGHVLKEEKPMTSSNITLVWRAGVLILACLSLQSAYGQEGGATTTPISPPGAHHTTGRSTEPNWVRELIHEFAKLRREVLESRVEAQQQKTSALEQSVEQLEAERLKLQGEEVRNLQQLALLDAQLATAVTGEQKVVIESEKAMLSGAELEQLRAKQSKLAQRAAVTKQQLTSEQQILQNLRQRMERVGSSR